VNFYSGITIYGEKAKVFEKKLKKFLEGKDFPLGNPVNSLKCVSKKRKLFV
jgi:hypothetical protein